MKKLLSSDEFYDVEDVVNRSTYVARVFGGSVRVLFKDEYVNIVIKCSHYSMLIRWEYNNPMIFGYLPDSGSLQDCQIYEDDINEDFLREIGSLTWERFFATVIDWFKSYIN